MPYPEWLDLRVLPGVSLYFVLIFFVPLAIAVAIPVLFATKSLAAWRKVLTILWLAGCVPAEMMMLMGLAFNYRYTEVLVTMAIWPFLGLIVIWLPLKLKEWVWKTVPP